jgi:hypothetical protein
MRLDLLPAISRQDLKWTILKVEKFLVSLTAVPKNQARRRLKWESMAL